MEHQIRAVILGQVEQFSWANDLTSIGLLGIVLVVIFWVIIPKAIDVYKDVLSDKLDLIIRVVVKSGQRTKHILKHQHDLLESQGHKCDHEEDDEDEPDLEVPT